MARTRPAILFVCLGNICRSPLAEAAFRHAADQARLDVTADSAGTGDWHVGRPPDTRAIAIARRHGLDISGFRARQIGPADFTRFTHIFALDRDNLANIRRLVRSAKPEGRGAETGLLLDLVAARAGMDVDDPYYGGDAGFEQTWADVSAAADALVTRLRG
jgi:protein-tyrosine phosphatase